MKRIIWMCFALCAQLLSGSTCAADSMFCQQNPTHQSCSSVSKKKPLQMKKVRPKKQIPEASPAVGPLQKIPRLTGKQEEMRQAYADCYAHSSPKDQTGDVVDFVFTEREKRERSLSTTLWSVFRGAHRGSSEHHGHEVCLVRAFGLRTFRTIREIRGEHGKALVPLDMANLAFPKDKDGKYAVPPERQYAREWVVAYATSLSKSFHEAFGAQMRVGSVVRDANVTQAKLVRDGASPADCRFEFLCSSHASGSAVDFGMKEMSAAQRKWIEARFVADQESRKIFFIIENSHYHVFVLPPEYMGEEQ